MMNVPFPAARNVRVALCVLLTGLAACSADRDTPVGSELLDDGLGSRPGVVSVDTLLVSGDFVFRTNRLIEGSQRVTLGRDSLYEHAIVLRPDFSGAGIDTARTVEKAELRMVFKDDGNALDDDLTVLFYELGREYSEGDTMSTLDTLGAILDPGDPQTPADDKFLRQLTQAVARYEVPPALAQAWIRGDSASNGMAVVYQGSGEQKMRFATRSDAEDPMQFIVTFVGGFSTNYPIGHDGTFTSERTTTPNHVVSDGVTRRLFMRADLSALSDSAAIHNARLRLHMVPGSVMPDGRILTLYVPDSIDPNDELFLSGVNVTATTATDSLASIDFAVTLTLLSTLQGIVDDNGFVVRFESEATELRRIEFYTSSAGVDSLRPKVFVTSSTPATFDP